MSKVVPRIPCVKSAEGFWAFSKAGRSLAELHLNYETVAMYPATVIPESPSSTSLLSEQNFNSCN
ncbi:type ISP restriction/modification enzyme [Herminiimonas glaciei]|uniref:Type ISP restriction/modification enzyme n=1 Tax=Herminiimonas glaciei TaxID=523788 RepID=A0ABW2I670_9BURK